MRLTSGRGLGGIRLARTTDHQFRSTPTQQQSAAPSIGHYLTALHVGGQSHQQVLTASWMGVGSARGTPPVRQGVVRQSGTASARYRSLGNCCFRLLASASPHAGYRLLSQVGLRMRFRDWCRCASRITQSRLTGRPQHVYC
jgi:hypothetical protein